MLDFFEQPYTLIGAAVIVLFVVFTIRESLIRVISARNMSRKERKIFEAA